jgi:hypothetical protein
VHAISQEAAESLATAAQFLCIESETFEKDNPIR